MDFKQYFPHCVAVSLLVLAGVFKSPAFAYASVVTLGYIIAYTVFKEIEAGKTYKASLPEEVRRQMQDLNARLTTLEYEKKMRGF